jgi:hypothetical protein
MQEPEHSRELSLRHFQCRSNRVRVALANATQALDAARPSRLPNRESLALPREGVGGNVFRARVTDIPGLLGRVPVATGCQTRNARRGAIRAGGPKATAICAENRGARWRSTGRNRVLGLAQLTILQLVVKSAAYS